MILHDPQAIRRLSVSENAYNSLTVMIYFDQMLHTCTCQHCLTTVMRNALFDGRGFAEHQSGRLRSVSEFDHYSLNKMVYLDQTFRTYFHQHFSSALQRVKLGRQGLAPQWRSFHDQYSAYFL